ncbi:hypothetical protein BD289DRAFT_424331 [Coniella lustricola]|uniref:DUF2470 domain-containing protein n=1 Tax=Coniella lustricola TaxID=2025994 RepID=A0A2T3AIL8_9PEZI|nr:hypothetical protein BD289DRAFT_424331 [Coniella lustricola]
MVTTRASTRSASSSTPPAHDPSPAGGTLEIDPVSKARTIAHMNQDHADDMVAILRHYAKLPQDQAADAEMLDLDFATMTVKSISGVHAVPLDPPMNTWSDRRSRLVDMTLEAREALGITGPVDDEHNGSSDHKKSNNNSQRRTKDAPAVYYPPEGVGFLSLAGVTFYFVCAVLVFSGHVERGSAVWRLVEAIRFPGGPETYVWLVRFLLLPMLAVHGFEAAHMARGRLAARNVPVGSTVWLLWVVNAFFEGVPVYQRWDRRILGKEKSH